MMKYGLFADVVKEKIKDYLPEQYKDAKAECRNVKKVNEEKVGLTIFTGDSMQVSPTIYLEDFYERYKENENLEQVLADIAVVFERGLGQVPDNKEMEKLREGNIDKSRIYYQLINTEQNHEMLSEMPSREFQDMSVIYRYLVSEGSNGIASVMITDKFAERENISEEELFHYASENTKKLFPISIQTMKDVLRGMLAQDGMPEDMAEQIIPEDGPLMYVVSNNRGINGAAAMLYEEGFGKLADQVNDDLFILPSSVHESIAVPVSCGGYSAEMLAGMVSDVNSTNVELSERLSNNVYFFDRETREITMATDVPERRLDCYGQGARAV